MKKTIFLSLGILFTILFIASCSKSDSTANNPNNTTNCDAVAKKFTADVNPVIQTFCNQSGCHNTNSRNGPGQLTNYNEVFSARSSIRAQVQAGLMPQNATLTAAQKNAIICWIDSGAPNN